MSALPAPKADNKPRTTAIPYGPDAYVVIHQPGKLLAAFPTRHDAVGWMATIEQGPHRYGMSEQVYDIQVVPVGEVPIDELHEPGVSEGIDE